MKKKMLLNLFALLLLPPVLAFGQNKPPVKVPVPANDHNPEVKALGRTSGNLLISNSTTLPPYKLTELQTARLDEARQELFRWEDKMQAALDKFRAICTAAQAENFWPPVQCSLTDLTVEAQPPPTPPSNLAPAASPQPPAKP